MTAVPFVRKKVGVPLQGGYNFLAEGWNKGNCHYFPEGSVNQIRDGSERYPYLPLHERLGEPFIAVAPTRLTQEFSPRGLQRAAMSLVDLLKLQTFRSGGCP